MINKLIEDEGTTNLAVLIERVRHLESLPLPVPGASGVSFPVRTETADYTIVPGDFNILADATGGAITITLPTAASAYDATNDIGDIYNIKRINPAPNAVTLAGDGAETIDGSNTQIIVFQYDQITVQSDGTEWWTVL